MPPASKTQTNWFEEKPAEKKEEPQKKEPAKLKEVKEAEPVEDDWDLEDDQSGYIKMPQKGKPAAQPQPMVAMHRPVTAVGAKPAMHTHTDGWMSGAA